MKSVLPNANDYNEKLIEHMLEKHNIKQYVNTSITENGSILDLCFSDCSNVESLDRSVVCKMTCYNRTHDTIKKKWVTYYFCRKTMATAKKILSVSNMIFIFPIIYV